MKKLFALLLAFSLLMSVSLALADESADVRDPTTYPNIAFGADQERSVEVFRVAWSQGYSFSNVPTYETVTLSDGSLVYVMTLAAVPSDYLPTTVKFYFIKDKLAAAVQEVSIPEGVDVSQFKARMAEGMGSGPVPLDIGKAGNAMELLGKDAHLEDGQDAWPYAVSVTVDANGTEAPASLGAVLTARIIDNKLYIAEFPYQNAAGQNAAAQNAAAQNLAELEGFDKLTEEEKNAVQLYADFLQKQQSETLAQYVDFLLKKHQ